MAFVLDASSCLAWCFHDEATPDTERLFRLALSDTRLYVPPHWPVEVLSSLMRAVRRGRIPDSVVDRFLTDISACNIVVDQRPMVEQWNNSLLLARTYKLSGYDAAYRSLAKHLQLPLATEDGRLRDAATIEGIGAP